MTPISTTVLPLSNDTYFISPTESLIFLEFADGTNGTNLTAGTFTGDTSQQWQVSGNSSTYYTFKNILYGNYISTQANVVTSSQTPYEWRTVGVEQHDNSYAISPESMSGSFWYMMPSSNGFGNGSVILNGPTVWYFNSTTNTQSSSHSSSTSGIRHVNIGAITGGVIGALVVLGAFTTFLCLQRRKRKRKAATYLKPTGFDIPAIPSTLADNSFASNPVPMRKKGIADTQPSISHAQFPPDLSVQSSTSAHATSEPTGPAIINAPGNMQLSDEQINLVTGLSSANVAARDIAELIGWMRAGRAGGPEAGGVDTDSGTAPPSYDDIRR